MYCEYSRPKNAIISGTKRFTYREFSANEQICCIYFVCFLCIRHVEGSVTCEKCHWPICSSSCISLGKVVFTLRQCKKCLDISIKMFRYIKIQVQIHKLTEKNSFPILYKTVSSFLESKNLNNQNFSCRVFEFWSCNLVIFIGLRIARFFAQKWANERFAQKNECSLIRKFLVSDLSDLLTIANFLSAMWANR